MLTSQQLAESWRWQSLGTPARSVILSRYNEGTDAMDAQPAQTVLVLYAERQAQEGGGPGVGVETQITDATIVWAPGVAANVAVGDRVALDGQTGVVDAVRLLAPYRTEAIVNFDQGGS